MIYFPKFNELTRIVRYLLIANLAVFVPAFFLSAFVPSAAQILISPLYLLPHEPWQIWRFVTYMFLHIEPLHFVFNMLMLWMLGNEVSSWLGEKRFLNLYLFSGVFAAILSVPVYLIFNDYVSVLGASGALFGVLVAFGWYFPERKLILIVFAVPARVAVGLLILLDILMLPDNSNVARSVHLAGALGGFAWLYWNERLMLTNNIVTRWIWNQRKKKEFAGRMQEKSGSLRGSKVEIGYFDEQKQMDLLLAKVSQHGVSALSKAEVEQLRVFSEKQRLRKGK